MFKILENKISENVFRNVTLVTKGFSLLLCKNSQLVVCFMPSSDWPICNDAIILQANGWSFGYVLPYLRRALDGAESTAQKLKTYL